MDEAIGIGAGGGGIVVSLGDIGLAQLVSICKSALPEGLGWLGIMVAEGKHPPDDLACGVEEGKPKGFAGGICHTDDAPGGHGRQLLNGPAEDPGVAIEDGFVAFGLEGLGRE